jgi:hypothetical protein
MTVYALPCLSSSVLTNHLAANFIIHIQEENNISILSTPHIPYDKVLNL